MSEEIIESGYSLGVAGLSLVNENGEVKYRFPAAAGSAGQSLFVDSSGEQLAFRFQTLPDGIPAGVIMMWSGSIEAIPAGFALCDGTNGTPDLRNRFIVGAGDTYTLGATGGSADATLVSHTHSVSDPGHSHSIPTNGTGVRWNAGGITGGSFTATKTGSGNTGSATTGISVSTEGESGTNKNLPPYYSLAYIMRI